MYPPIWPEHVASEDTIESFVDAFEHACGNVNTTSRDFRALLAGASIYHIPDKYRQPCREMVDILTRQEAGDRRTDRARLPSP